MFDKSQKSGKKTIEHDPLKRCDHLQLLKNCNTKPNGNLQWSYLFYEFQPLQIRDTAIENSSEHKMGEFY